MATKANRSKLGRPVIAVVDCTEEDARRLTPLMNRFELRIYYQVPDEEQLIERARGCQAVITIFTYTKFTEHVISSLPDLRLIATRTAGYSHIDVTSATAHGVAVANVPHYAGPSVGEFVFGLVLTLVRKIREADADVKRGNWNFTSFLGYELRGKTLGIIGLGDIGQYVARLAKAFGMEVITYSLPYEPELETSLQVQYVSLEDLLRRSDIISVHVPLTTETRGLIDAQKLALVKEGAILVNTARGGIINEDALYQALLSGQLGGACLDVVEEEPPRKGNPLFTLPNVIATPHIAWHTREAIERQFEETMKNVIAFFEGELRCVVNASELLRSRSASGGK